MVSGLVTSPCDQLRIFSGEATLIRIASKSATGLARSKGLERYKVFLRFLRRYAATRGSQTLACLTVRPHRISVREVRAPSRTYIFLNLNFAEPGLVGHLV